MAIITRFEESRDIQNVVMQTITQQDTSEIATNPDARSYRQDQQDGIWTLTEEILIDQGGGTWSSDGSASTEPIETHSKFENMPSKVKDLWTAWKRNPSDEFLNRAENQIGGKPWTPSAETNETFVSMYSYIKKGVESFLSPRLTARFTELEDGPADMSNIGKIDGKPSEVFGLESQFWLLSGARSQQEGNKWRNTYEWLSASPHGFGWDEELYQ